MKRLLAITLLLLSTTVPAFGRGKLQGWAQQGGQKVTTNGIASQFYFQRSYPSSTVTVYNAGTLTLARTH